ncbi:MAG: CvpA family protein [Clostridia bacterium]|nr:CvpA family protein [Clostridia bacterium]
MSIILDLIIVAIIVFAVILSARHGFVRTVIELAGFVAAFVIAFSVSSPLADVTYDKMIKPSIVSSVDSGAEVGKAEAADEIWESLPEIAKNCAESFGITKESFKNEALKATGNTSQVVERVADKAVKPAVTKILSIIYSTVIVIILIVVSKLLARIINRLLSFSFVGTVNRFLGGVVGVFKGAAFAALFCMVISILVLFTKDGLPLFTTENIDSTLLFKTFYGISPFI